jgi:CspA family cold shock protein
VVIIPKKIKINKNRRMKTGTVKFYNEAKGFGFITDENGTDVFVHATGLIDEIKEKDSVSFEVTEGKKGLNAVNVSVNVSVNA